SVRRVGRLQSSTTRVHEFGNARPAGATAGLGSSRLSRWKTDLRPSPPPPPRHHRTHSAQPSIPTHTRWPAHRAVLLPDLCPPAPAETRPNHARGAADYNATTHRIRPTRIGNPCLLRTGAACCLNLTHSNYNFLDKDSSGDLVV